MMNKSNQRLKQVQADRESVIVLSESGIWIHLPHNTLTRIECIPPKAGIASRKSHSLFRTIDGTVYGLGSNSLANLGQNFRRGF